jgi:hypothetical protein
VIKELRFNWHMLKFEVENALTVYRKMNGFDDSEAMDGDDTELFAKAVLALADDVQGNATPRETNAKLYRIEQKLKVCEINAQNQGGENNDSNSTNSCLPS